MRLDSLLSRGSPLFSRSPHGACVGASCEFVCSPPCSPGIFPCSESISGTLMLVVIYGAILGIGAKLISDGAEGVLELWPE